MMTKRIEEFNQQQLGEIAEASPFPKWASMSRLRFLGLPTLDGLCLSAPPENPLISAIREFAQAHGVDCVQIRSDRAREHKSYYRGGNTFPVERAAGEVAWLLRQGRSAILLEPTNRFSNKLNVGILIESRGRLVIEVLGPGFDVSDLTRGGISPEIYWSIENIDWHQYEEPWCWDFRAIRTSGTSERVARRLRRLNRLAADILPRLLGTAADCISAETWLKEQGFTDLWTHGPLMVDLAWLFYWYDCAFIVANYSFRPREFGSVLSMSGSLLEDGRFVFWDVVDSRRKFARV